MHVFQLDASEDIPLAICHAHLEAMVTPHDMNQFAKSKGKVLPPEAFPKDYKYDPSNWPSFANPYLAIFKLMDSRDDFRYLTQRVLQRYKEQGVAYVEIMFSPEDVINCEGPVQWQDMLSAGQEAITQAEADGKITVTGLVTFLRGPQDPSGHGTKGDNALKYVQFLISNKDELPNFRGIHLSGDEDSYPGVQQFVNAYQLARSHGYGCAVHAGETGNTQNMWDAITYLLPDRIGHGIAAIKDSNLIATLQKLSIPLEMCVSSNFCMSNVKTLCSHPLPDLMKAGVECLFGNTDDDRLFNTDPIVEMRTLKNVFGFTQAEILDNTIRTIRRGFLPEDKKMGLIAAIMARHPRVTQEGFEMVSS